MADPDKEIAKLINQYKSKPLLPLELPVIIKRLKRKNASVLDFQNQYSRDPLLCSYLIDLAWRKTKNRVNHPFAADHAMNTVGIDGANQFLSRLSLDLNSDTLEKQTEFHNELKFVMSSSLLAAELAKNLSNNQHKSNILYWASMAHQFPDLLLWYLKPKIMWRIQYRQIKLPKKLTVFEQAKLGFELNQWRQVVAKEWHMSETNQITYTKIIPYRRKQLLEYMRNGYSDNTPVLKNWYATDSWQILTANWLSRSILAPWLRNSYRHYFFIAKQAFSLSDKKLNHCIVNSIRNTSLRLKGSQLFVPANLFLFQNIKTNYPKWLNATAKLPAKSDFKFIKKTEQLKQVSDDLVVHNFIRELKQTPSKFANKNKIFYRLLELSIKNLGFSRACLLTPDWNNQQVATSLCQHQKGCQKIKFSFNFQQKTPLSKFLVEQGFLLFDIKKHSKIWHKLPKEIVQQQVKNFIFYSIKPGSKVEALIYLDLKGKSLPSEDRIKLTKLLLRATNDFLKKHH